VQAKARFQNLDDFLNESESEEESEESGDDPTIHLAEADSADDSSESEDATEEESADENDGLVQESR
jgi:hypothetical protein